MEFSKHFAAFLLFAALSQAQSLTTITDMIRDGAGVGINGSCTFTAATGRFQGAANDQIVGEPVTVKIVAGVFSKAIMPTDTGLPAGQYYSVKCVGNRGWSRTGYWIVPTSATPLTLKDIWAAIPPAAGILVPPAQIGQGGATVGQGICWLGSIWGAGNCGGGGGGALTSVFGRIGVVVATTGDYNSSQITESGNLFFTPARARSAFSATLPIAFDSSTGIFSCPTCGAGGSITSVFGRTGVVAQVSGDYTAAQVTNAVSTAGAYTDPSWLTLTAAGGRISGFALTAHLHTGVYEPVDITILRQANLAGSGSATTPARSDHTHTGVYAPLASPVFTGTVTTPITGSVQCLHANAAGVLSGTGADCGSGGGGANASGYYFVSQATSAPANAVNLGLLTTGLLKISVAGAVATPSTAVIGDIPTGYPYANLAGSPAIPAASSTSPVMDGTAAVGTGVTFARNDHVHPMDTSRQATIAGAPGSWPATFTPSAHTHPTSDIVSGTFAISFIPTGTTGITVALGNHLHAGVYEPAITAGTTAQYLRGDKSLSTFATDAISAVTWTTITGKPGTFAPSAHAASHQNGGADEIATATAAANAIPKAGAGGTLAGGWIPLLNQNTTGNAGTATALAAAPTTCGAGQAATGINASGTAQGCQTYTVTIASGTSALGTASIASYACATVVSTTATGALSTDSISWTPNGSVKAITGYAPVAAGGLSIAPYASAGNVNFDVCNLTASAIVPGALTLNWRIVR